MVSNNLFRHQEASINLIRKYPEIPYIFLIGGFGCGKSTTDVYLCEFLLSSFKSVREPITIGILGVTIKLLKQTVLKDLKVHLEQGGIEYKDNSQQGTLTVGNVTFVYLPMQDPDDIYAHNFHAAICDEIDEVPSERVLAIVKAIQERNRKVIPASRYMPQRDPFIFFSTTAQGLGGTYQLIESFKEKGVPYAKIRGRTEDNTSLAKSQIRLLKQLYTPEEAEAFLEGKFVNLKSGRAYPEFAANKHVYMRFGVKPDERIYVGQDFNLGYNAAVMLIAREGKLYVIDARHWDYIGNAPSRLRQLYPTNPITLIPDASGKEIMESLEEQFEDNNIELYWNARNPSVTERNTAINKAFQFGQLYVMTPQNDLVTNEHGINKLKMCLETRGFADTTGKPEKGSGPTALDHWGDALEYGVWRIIHGINGFEKILQAIKAVHHVKAAIKDAEFMDAAQEVA